ncbi:MAG: hypothetical protein IJ035_01375 [Oscillospiraceae bacterium]|nr:hypothetical protein [Oscillospiraceae bacterium]
MGWIFVPLIIAAVIVTIVVMRNPEQKKTEEQKKDATLAAKVLSVVIDVLLVFAGSVGTLLGVILLSPYPFIIAAVTVTIFVMRNPEQKKTEEQKKDAAFAAKVLSVVINVLLAFAGFVGTLWGVILLYPYSFQLSGGYNEPEVYGVDFLWGLFLIVISIVVPAIANLLLYRFWYSKCGLSKKWIYIPITIITVGLLTVSVFFIVVGYIDGRINAEWHW